MNHCWDSEINIEETKTSLRRINRNDYPELRGYSNEDIWSDNQGPGGLYLAAHMSRFMDLHNGNLVLDLGCGMGESSIFLAKHLGVRVVAVDLWTNATYLSDKFMRRGYQSEILPLNLDAREQLPFAEDYFDAIFCMNSLSFFGGDVESLDRLARLLKQGGSFCVGGECMSREFTEEEMQDPPTVYSFVEGIWENDFLKLHSPPWWEELFTASRILDVTKCMELDDGVIMHEEKIMATSPEGYLGLSPEEVEDIEVRQILYGHENEPHMTVFMIVASRK